MARRSGLTELPAAHVECKFDLELTVQHTREGLRIALLYAKTLFRRATAERFLGNLRRVLEQTARDARCAACATSRMLQPWERETLLEDFNPADVAGADAKPRWSIVFARHVRERPEAIAVEDAHGTYTSPSSIAARRCSPTSSIARGVGARRRRRAGDAAVARACSSRSSA